MLSPEIDRIISQINTSSPYLDCSYPINPENLFLTTNVLLCTFSYPNPNSTQQKEPLLYIQNPKKFTHIMDIDLYLFR